MYKIINENKYLVQQVREEKTKAGIIIQADAQMKTDEALVVGAFEDDDPLIGKTVILQKFSGTVIEDKDNVVISVIDIDDILVVIEEDN